MANIKVAVRVRPISEREITVTGAEIVVHTDSNAVSLTNLKVSASKAGDSRERTRRYGFDYCFNSSDPDEESYATQEKLYETLGTSILDALFAGYNSCLIAYGQSASGKTYTMMGPKGDPGLTPRLCEGLFLRISEDQKHERHYQTSVSYLEIYNERVRDLLKPSSIASSLRVREHPRLGPYVQGLTLHSVSNLGSLMSYVEEGTKARKTAATLQNPTSSRSHALLTVSLTPRSQNSHSSPESKNFSRGSRLHLVDLAGSEKAATCSGIHRLKEGANINKSLVALGNVISALAERGATGSGPGRRFIPYRDSALTWLLKDALGGNATTVMLATISPASGSYNETAHTLRFAQRAQSVVNRPVVNEDPVARIIRELRAEVSRLKSLLLEKNIGADNESVCCCKNDQEEEKEHPVEAQQNGPAINFGGDDSNSNISDSCSIITDIAVRKYGSDECLITKDIRPEHPLRKFGSLECIGARDTSSRDEYTCANVLTLKSDETNALALVDIPTLVAVLIKPDDSQEHSVQIEEIYNDNVSENSVDREILENPVAGEESNAVSLNDEVVKSDYTGNDAKLFRPAESDPPPLKRDHGIEDHLSGIIPIVSENTSSDKDTKAKLRKQDSIDVVTSRKPTNLNASKKFGSIEGLAKSRESNESGQKFHANSEKRNGTPEKNRKLNNIKEGEDRKSAKAVNSWRSFGLVGKGDAVKELQRKGSNDSDRSARDSSLQKTKYLARKQSTEGLKRKTSKDSSSSSSKEDQTSTSTTIRDKTRRKGSVSQEDANRSHTPIQRTNRRAEIVAAVTQRLYSTKKNSENTTANTPGSEFRSPESSDVKLANTTRMKLQEISRKMLAKRRKICVDTQTDNNQTVRVRDTASLTDGIEVTRKDIGILTDCHDDCESLSEGIHRVLRVKEIGTVTERLKRPTVRCRDVGLSTDACVEDMEYAMHFPRNDSGILSDDTQNYAESNLSSTEVSDLFVETDHQVRRKAELTDNSTNTVQFPENTSSGAQTAKEDVTIDTKNFVRDCHHCHGIQECNQTPLVRNTERNVISISLPDMISITIESSNLVESKIAVTDGNSDEKMKIVLKDSESQTEQNNHLVEQGTSTDENNKKTFFNDLSISTKPNSSQGDGRTFRIENIFQDPKNTCRTSPKIEILPDLMENGELKNSLIFRNSVGTSFVPETKESSTEMENENFTEEGVSWRPPRRRSSINDILSKELSALTMTKRSNSSSPRRRSSLTNSNYPLPEALPVLNPVKGIQLTTCGAKFEIQPLPKQEPENETSLSDRFSVEEDGNQEQPCERYSPEIWGKEEAYRERSPKAEIIKDTVYFSVNDLKSPSLVARVNPKNVCEPDPNFSDDSLDLDELSAGNRFKETESGLGTSKSCKAIENFCPPDVVAHTKRESPKPFALTETNIVKDFEDDDVEFPKTNPNDVSPLKDSQVHDYKSLILGGNYFVPIGNGVRESRDTENGTDFTSTDRKGLNDEGASFSGRKKKVSFSHSEILNREFQNFNFKYSSPTPKSIIKKQNCNCVPFEPSKLLNANDFIVESAAVDSTPSPVPESSLNSILKSTLNTSTPLDRSNSEGSFKDDVSSISGHSGLALKQGTFYNSEDESDGTMRSPQGADLKKVRFSAPEFMDHATSDSDDCDNTASDNESCGKEPHDVFAEYLDEAASFMRNMNSMNEYMSASKLFEKYLEHKNRQSNDLGEENSDDFIEYKGRRVSLVDNTDEFLKDDSFVVPIDSYENCLKGIQRLENCIDKAERHNQLLQEKYGINIESADTKFGLVEPSIDSKRLDSSVEKTLVTKPNEASGLRRPKDVSSSAEELTGIEQRKWRSIVGNDEEIVNNNVILHYEDNFDDLEARIFKYLMDSADPNRYRDQANPRVQRTSKVSAMTAKSPNSYSKLRENSSHRKRDTFPKSDHSEYTLHPTEKVGGVRNYFADEKENEMKKYFPGSYEREQSPRPTESLSRTTEIGDLKAPDCFLTVPTTTGTRSPSESNSSRRKTYSSSPGKSFTSRNGCYSNNTTSSSEAIGTSTESIDTVSGVRDRLKYPGSPRARLLQLLSERRWIVQRSRSTSSH